MKKYIILLVLCLFVFGCESHANPADKTSQQEIVCDNGLSDWLKSDSEFGQWLAKSIRIVQIGRKKYQPQFKDCNDEKAKWTPMFENDKNLDSLTMAQYHTRNSVAIQKGICDAFQNLNLDDKKD